VTKYVNEVERRLTSAASEVTLSRTASDTSRVRTAS
jgi:hypothetical protein